MSQSAGSVIRKVAGDLERGSVRLAQLGDTDGEQLLALSTPEAMARYAQIMTPQIRSALANNNRLEVILISLLVSFFAAACGLTIAAHAKEWPLAANASVIPGLGATSVWPIRKLSRLRNDNLTLELLPVLLPMLTPADAREVVCKVLGVKAGAKK